VIPASILAVALSPMNRALNRIPKRAEKQEGSQLHETFVDSGVADILNTVDHQLVYGRRGTGKTHALSYLATEVSARGDVALNLDLRTIGSPDGVLDARSASPADRAARLLVDLLGQLHDALLEAVLNDESLLGDDTFIEKADALLTAITSIRVTGDVELSVEAERRSANNASASLKASLSSKPGLEAGIAAGNVSEGRGLLRETRRGSERISLNFSDVARALRELAGSLSSRRVWLLLDEWSSVPGDIQPYLGEFLVRCVLPLQRFTVKVAAIEQQTNFMTRVDGNLIGIEVGADMGANINLDDFLVYEGNEERSREFFRGLFFKHLKSVGEDEADVDGLDDARDVIRLGFTDIRAFDELVRAAEGVPRDALYIAGRAASRAGQGAISVPLVREAARWWFQTDKSRPLAAQGREEAQRLLTWVIAKVIREKRARAFLVNEANGRDPLLLALFDARVLHMVRRGYSAQDQPGERYDVWVIDYGAYVDLIQTQNAPRGALLFVDEADEERYVDIDVPLQVLRALRRAILDLSGFYAAGSQTARQ